MKTKSTFISLIEHRILVRLVSNNMLVNCRKPTAVTPHTPSPFRFARAAG